MFSVRTVVTEINSGGRLNKLNIGYYLNQQLSVILRLLLLQLLGMTGGSVTGLSAR
jgi:hypothetical protein